MGCGKSKAAADGPEKKDDAPAKPKEAPFAFVSGLPDCCTSNPDNYKVVAELPNARLVEMTLPVGQEDKPHDHPGHSMYVIQGGKLAITAYGEDGKAGATNEVEIPSGAPPIFPAGAHQVKNVGDTEVKIVFVEPLPACKPCEDVAGYLSPFKVAPQCYEVLAENDEWWQARLELS
jgi:quercetin dioxygenase-like cupin family protein